jgi:hypothetical protein
MKRLVCILIWMLSSTVLCIAQNTVYFPQVADGQAGGYGWNTIVVVTNPAAIGTSPASGTLTFTQDNGNAFNLQFTDLNNQPAGSGNTIPFQISGGQTRFYLSSGTGVLATGYGTVTSNLPVTAMAIFQEFQTSGSPVASAGVPPATPLTRQAVVFYEGAGGSSGDNSDTGVAIANPNNTAASVTLQLLNANGTAALPPSTISIPAGNHTAKFISQLFSGTAGMNGTMQITSSVGVVTTALYFNGNGTFFSAPVITLALIDPAIRWFDRRNWLTLMENPLA